MNRKKVSRFIYITWVIESLAMMCYWKFVMGYGIFEVHMNPYAGLSALNGVLIGLYIGIGLFSPKDE